MPEVPSRNRFNNRNIGTCAGEGMMIVMRCNGCRREVRYWASDLLLVLDFFHEAHVPPWPCSRCRTIEYMKMRWVLPSAADLQAGIVVRRPVQQVTKWIWRNEKT